MGKTEYVQRGQGIYRFVNICYIYIDPTAFDCYLGSAKRSLGSPQLETNQSEKAICAFVVGAFRICTNHMFEYLEERGSLLCQIICAHNSLGIRDQTFDNLAIKLSTWRQKSEQPLCQCYVLLKLFTLCWHRFGNMPLQLHIN